MKDYDAEKHLILLLMIVLGALLYLLALAFPL
jgi:hypothetical protein